MGQRLEKKGIIFATANDCRVSFRSIRAKINYARVLRDTFPTRATRGFSPRRSFPPREMNHRYSRNVPYVPLFGRRLRYDRTDRFRANVIHLLTWDYRFTHSHVSRLKCNQFFGENFTRSLFFATWSFLALSTLYNNFVEVLKLIVNKKKLCEINARYRMQSKTLLILILIARWDY